MGHERGSGEGSWPLRARRALALAALALAGLLAPALTTPAAAAEGPENITLPAISGTVKIASSVKASNGTWSSPTTITYTYQWLRCDAAGEECTDIAGAMLRAYRLKPEDYAHTLRVRVTATNATGSSSATSKQTVLVPPAKPARKVLPKITGVAQEGKVLTSGTGEWKGTPPFSYSFQWRECVGTTCVNIPGATAQTYRIATQQVGKKVRAVVTATNPSGSASAPSNQTSKILSGPPVNIAIPSVSGTPIVTQTLSAAAGLWAGTAPISFSYQWMSCNALSECNPIPGATGPTYTPGPLDIGNTIDVVVTGTNSVGQESVTSEPTGLIQALLPTNAGLPSISGLLQDGRVIAANVGSWTGTEPISYAFQWQLCNTAGEACNDISEAVGSTLQLSPADVGSTLRVIVTATNQAGSVSAVSGATSVVQALLPGNTALPSISGVLQEGHLLSAATGSWTGTEPISYAYQWQLCNAAGEACKDVAEALGATFKLSSAQIGSTLRVAVTATNAAGSTVATSEPTAVVGAVLPGNTSLPTISGLLKDGQLLSASSGTWSGTEPISYSYQWQVCNAAGEACKDIAEAVESTFKLSPADVGSTLRVVVKATNGAGSTTATSEPTGVVAALLPSNTAPPSISGLAQDGQLLSASSGTWSGTEPFSYGFQWQVCNAAGEASSCTNIAKATESTLGLTSALVGSTVRIVVTAKNSAGSESAASNPTGVVAALLPGNTALPVASGKAEDGQLLSTTNGTWSGTTPMSFAYQWQLCNAAGEPASCVNVTEAGTGSTLSLIPEMVGKTARVVVTATNSGGSTSAPSAASSVILAVLPKNTALPKIEGILKNGQLLSVTNGTWTGTPPITFAYQWQRCNAEGKSCKNIAEALSSSYLLGLLDVGSTLRTVVTATNARGSVPATSEASGLILGLALSPTSGTAGTQVSIKGAGVDEVTSVKFGSTKTSNVEVQSPEEITAVAPAGTGSVPVTVATPEGSSHPTSSVEFTYG